MKFLTWLVNLIEIYEILKIFKMFINDLKLFENTIREELPVVALNNYAKFPWEYCGNFPQLCKMFFKMFLYFFIIINWFHVYFQFSHHWKKHCLKFSIYLT